MFRRNPQQARMAMEIYMKKLLDQNGGDLDKALAAYGGFKTKDPSEYINKIKLKMGVGGTQPVFSNMQKAENPWTRGIDLQDPYYNQLMGLVMDTPDFRRDMAKQTERTDSTEKIAANKMELELQKARLKEQFVKDPKTAQEVYSRLLAKKGRGEQLSESEIETFNMAASAMESLRPVAPSGTTINPAIGSE